jgi:hypothetical protein
MAAVTTTPLRGVGARLGLTIAVALAAISAVALAPATARASSIRLRLRPQPLQGGPGWRERRPDHRRRDRQLAVSLPVAVARRLQAGVPEGGGLFVGDGNASSRVGPITRTGQVTAIRPMVPASRWWCRR